MKPLSSFKVVGFSGGNDDHDFPPQLQIWDGDAYRDYALIGNDMESQLARYRTWLEEKQAENARLQAALSAAVAECEAMETWFDYDGLNEVREVELIDAYAAARAARLGGAKETT